MARRKRNSDTVEPEQWKTNQYDEIAEIEALLPPLTDDNRFQCINARLLAVMARSFVEIFYSLTIIEAQLGAGRTEE